MPNPLALDRLNTSGATPELTDLFRAGLKSDGEALLWLDLELTGLDLARDRIVEIAVVASDMALTRFLPGPQLVINPELGCDYQLELNDWCKTTFAANGLADLIKQSTVSTADAVKAVVDFIDALKPDNGMVWYLAGSSVHVDRQFLCAHMPQIIDRLSHRIVDVSSFATMSWRWSERRMKSYRSAAKYAPLKTRADRRERSFLQNLGLSAEAKDPTEGDQQHAAKQVDSKTHNAHRAQDDVIASIKLLQFIKANVMR